MFGTKLANASAKINALVALVMAAGLKPALDAAALADEKSDASGIPAPAAMEAHLAEQHKAAMGEATTKLQADVAAAQARVGAIEAGLAAAGIKFAELNLSSADFAAPEGKTVADAPAVAKIKAAIDARIGLKSAQVVAATGHPAALEVPAAAGGAPDASATPQNATEFLDTFHALEKSDPIKAREYFRKHQARFPSR